MSSRYRVDYHLKEHRRDEFITWIKALVSTPFVLNTIESINNNNNNNTVNRYCEILQDIEMLIIDHINNPQLSKLSKLVPSIGKFFTVLPLVDAFKIQDNRRCISKRKFVAPSFNDIRQILNTAQLIALKDNLKLITFDGDITLYEDGNNLEGNSPILKYLLELLKMGVVIGIVTAAGYNQSNKYYERLFGLIDGIKESEELTLKQKENLLVIGGESNYLLRYNNEIGGLQMESSKDWLLDEMKLWDDKEIERILSFGYGLLKEFTELLNINDKILIIVKERAVGIIPMEGIKLEREILEEIVLRIDKSLREKFQDSNINWCAFNGGRDVWIDIGDKSLGVRILQNFVNKELGEIIINESNTLHVGDQFASLGNNDYASRTAAATAWVASPSETEILLNDLVDYMM